MHSDLGSHMARHFLHEILLDHYDNGSYLIAATTRLSTIQLGEFLCELTNCLVAYFTTLEDLEGYDEAKYYALAQLKRISKNMEEFN